MLLGIYIWHTTELMISIPQILSVPQGRESIGALTSRAPGQAPGGNNHRSRHASQTEQSRVIRHAVENVKTYDVTHDTENGIVLTAINTATPGPWKNSKAADSSSFDRKVHFGKDLQRASGCFKPSTTQRRCSTDSAGLVLQTVTSW